MGFPSFYQFSLLTWENFERAQKGCPHKERNSRIKMEKALRSLAIDDTERETEIISLPMRDDKIMQPHPFPRGQVGGGIRG
jgi:hypothetical protein